MCQEFMEFFMLEFKAAIATEVHMTGVSYSIVVVICISYFGDLPVPVAAQSKV
jgi:hypothetical protein